MDNPVLHHDLPKLYSEIGSCPSTDFYIPDDEFFSSQTGFYDSGDRHDIHAPEAWDVATGASRALGGERVTVGVVDNGFARDHEDLASNFWINPGEDLNGDGIIEPEEINGDDDDLNGYTDDFYGWDFVGHDNDLPVEWHGTGVTGLIAARGNNMIGVAGVSWYTNLVPTVAAHNDEGETYLDAFRYARDLRDAYDESGGQYGAYVVAVNRSQGEIGSRCINESAANTIINSLGLRGILTILAAGNQGTRPEPNIDHPNGYISPQTCPSQYTIVVMSSRDDDELAGSCYGGWEDVQSVDLAAPGFNQITTYPNDTYQNLTGTSFSAPEVAGAVALLHSVPNPSFFEYYRNTSASAVIVIKDIILESVDEWNGPTDHNLTNGRLNVGTAVRRMCNYYHDNGHVFQSNARTATGPSSNSNIAVGRGNHTVYTDGNNVFYAWNSYCNAQQRIYKLTSNMYSGTQPSIASSEEQNATDVYMAWLGGPQGVSVLEHKIIGDCLPTSGFQEEWRLAKIETPVPSGEGVVVSCPVVVKEAGTIPVVLLAVSGGANAGVHYWRAPGIVWHDFETWTHGVIPASADQNVTSVSAYTWEGSNELQVAWTTGDDEVFFIRGTESGTTYTWDANSYVEVSATVPLAQNFC